MSEMDISPIAGDLNRYLDEARLRTKGESDLDILAYTQDLVDHPDKQ